MKSFTTYLCFSAAIAPAFVLSSCTDNSPAGVREQLVTHLTELGTICDDFNQGKIDSDTAVLHLNDMRNEAELIKKNLDELNAKAETKPELKAEIDALSAKYEQQDQQLLRQVLESAAKTYIRSKDVFSAVTKVLEVFK